MNGTLPKRRRTVATRVLLSYAIVTLAFALVAGWAVQALQSASEEAVLMRSGYLPLALALRTASANQDIWNTQLNHVTATKNPADTRAWLELALKGGRPKIFAELRRALDRALSTEGAPVREEGRKFASDVTGIERYLSEDREEITKLFDALHARDERAAEASRDRLVLRGIEGKRRLNLLQADVDRLVEGLIAEARTRERLAMRLLVVLAAFTLLVGVAMAFYARLVLAPLAAVTERANAVARGDLTPRPAIASNDEIGELAQTFEGMVRAISKANADLLAAERLATIGKMAAHVTHEIRNPLSALALNVDLLEDEVGHGTEAQGLLRAIKGEVDRLTAVSERYLSVARRKPPRFEEEAIGELCEEAVAFVRREIEQHRIKVVTEVEPGLPLLMVDEGQIKQALYNLLRNAREATSAGGTIAVFARGRGDGGIDIVVEDEGEGIDDAVRERLFEPFFTTKSHGTGLGLVVTREVVEAHGGTIVAEPRQPRGTRFVIRLPARDGAAVEAPAALHTSALGTS